MLVDIYIGEKSFGSKILYEGLDLIIEHGEKIGLVGRNGTGKSTLLNIISGEDIDYDGQVKVKKGISIISSRQEHHDHLEKTVVDYIAGDLPEFKKLNHIIDTYPETMGDSPTKMQNYSDALERFNQLGYFEVGNEIEEALKQYQIDTELANGPLSSLSGGQKRMAELVKVQRARAHLALIDEPTNHMDYAAKSSFITWMKHTKEAVLVITHDRDVLQHVDRIVEIRDGHADIFKGSYDDYLRINAVSISSEVNQYQIVQARITNLKTDVIRFRRLKEKARNPGTIQRFKALERRAVIELFELEARDKPSFWIDKDSVKNMNSRVSKSYESHKTRNIRIDTKSKSSRSSALLIEALKLQLTYGYDPLFQPISFQLREGDRIQLHGRNGAGKSTIVSHLISGSTGKKPQSKIIEGIVEIDNGVRIGVYEQEIDEKYLKMTLSKAVEDIYFAKDVKISDEKIKRLLSDYLFNPAADGEMPVSMLSGGQKARLQIISMLAGEPNILILDEPTNHLDLPSIEEIESSLAEYNGAIIYISHDSYFAKAMGGQIVEVKAA